VLISGIYPSSVLAGLKVEAAENEVPQASSGVGNRERASPSQPTSVWGSVVSSPVGSGLEPWLEILISKNTSGGTISGRASDKIFGQCTLSPAEDFQ